MWVGTVMNQHNVPSKVYHITYFGSEDIISQSTPVLIVASWRKEYTSTTFTLSQNTIEW